MSALNINKLSVTRRCGAPKSENVFARVIAPDLLQQQMLFYEPTGDV